MQQCVFQSLPPSHILTNYQPAKVGQLYGHSLTVPYVDYNHVVSHSQQVSCTERDKIQHTTMARTARPEETLVPCIMYAGVWVPIWSEDYMKKYKDFKIGKDDIIINGFPKCGASWIQQMMYLIVNGMEYEDPAGPTVEERIAFIEYDYPGLDVIAARTGRQLLKSHLPYDLMPPSLQAGNGKLILVARNPKDVAVSLYHFSRMNNKIKYTGSFEEFFEKYINDSVYYGPYSKWLESFWRRRNDDNVLFLMYEDLKQDLGTYVRMMAKFLNKDLSEEILNEITDKCQFKTMKDDKTCNYSWWDNNGMRNPNETKFFRKGEVGDWKNYFTPEMSRRVEEKYKFLEDMGLHFKYEL